MVTVVRDPWSGIRDPGSAVRDPIGNCRSDAWQLRPLAYTSATARRAGGQAAEI